MTMWKEFKAFIMRGSVLDLAVGIIIGAAFGRIVTSLVNDVIMPPIGLLLAKVDFASLFWNISGTPYDSLDAARKAGAAVIAYGPFINNIIDFIIVAFIIFLLVRGINKLFIKPVPPAAANTKDCPHCFTAIPTKATRCPNCTSEPV
jgi:large conductance mechanosensitive channel